MKNFEYFENRQKRVIFPERIMGITNISEIRETDEYTLKKGKYYFGASSIFIHNNDKEKLSKIRKKLMKWIDDYKKSFTFLDGSIITRNAKIIFVTGVIKLVGKYVFTISIENNNIISINCNLDQLQELEKNKNDFIEWCGLNN